MSDQINPLEKKIITIALLVSAAHLGLVAYAAIRLGIAVPTCVTNVKPFTAGSFIKTADKRYEIHVLAKMWGFEPNRITLPTGSVADIYLVSQDVTHGFHINGTNVNLMAVPFVVNYAQAKFFRAGTFPIVCHEYCGAGHQAMSATIVVSDSVSEGHAEGIPGSTLGANLLPGRKILETKACLSCHSLDGKLGVGPTFKAIWGRKEEMADGTIQVVDADYIRESILSPQKKLVKGFGPVMPKLPVTPLEIDQVIDYLKTVN